jgi:hypothetical protein
MPLHRRRLKPAAIYGKAPLGLVFAKIYSFILLNI